MPTMFAVEPTLFEDNLSSNTFDKLVKDTLIGMGYPLIGLPENEAKRARALALEKLQVHRRCSFCGSLTESANRKVISQTSGSVCNDCQRSSERRKRFGCW